MNTPFRLDEHRRRPQPPLTAPPDRYFEQLPTRVMQRVQPAGAEHGPAWGWLRGVSAPLRTALASVVVLGGFAASFLLNSAPVVVSPRTASATLAQVPQEQMLQYLLASEQRLTLSDLADLPVTQELTAEAYLHASPEEVQAVLDAQPTEDAYL